jgi:hypothetical protein
MDWNLTLCLQYLDWFNLRHFSLKKRMTLNNINTFWTTTPMQQNRSKLFINHAYICDRCVLNCMIQKTHLNMGISVKRELRRMVIFLVVADSQVGCSSIDMHLRKCMHCMHCMQQDKSTYLDLCTQHKWGIQWWWNGIVFYLRTVEMVLVSFGGLSKE